MRLFLLPISTRRTLIYCDRSPLARNVVKSSTTTEKEKDEPQSYLDRATTKAATTWSDWENANGGWKKTLTTYGNAFLRRIPYEEWGLKSLPPLTSKLRDAYDAGKKSTPILVLFPSSFLPTSKVAQTLSTLSMERQDLHRKRMIGSAIGAPLTLPFALIPVLPNIPGFYLLFRAFSHYRALYGAKHLELLISKNFLKETPSKLLDQVYTSTLLPSTKAHGKLNPESLKDEDINDAATRKTKESASEVMLLDMSSGSAIAAAFGVKEMAIEIERAVEQVNKSLEKSTNDTMQ